MKTNKILLGGLAGGVTFFLLGWLIYGVLLMGFSKANYNQCAMRPMEEMVWWAMILSNLAFGFLLAIVFGWSNTSGAVSGLKVGGTLGLLISVSVDLSFYATSNMFLNLSGVLVDFVAFSVMSAIAGLVVGWVMGMGKK